MSKPTYEQLAEQVRQLTEQRDAVVAGLSGRKFFMYSDDSGFEIFETREEAIEAAQEMIDACREDAYDGWPEEADTIRWGVVIQQAQETDFKKPAPENGWEGSSDYKLLPETPATDAIRDSMRAEGINYAASRLAAAYNHGFVDKPLAEVFDVVRMILTAKEDMANDPALPADGLSGEYAEKTLEEWCCQLRKSKGATS